MALLYHHGMGDGDAAGGGHTHAEQERRFRRWQKGPYLNDVCKNFGIFDPPRLHLATGLYSKIDLTSLNLSVFWDPLIHLGADII